MAGRVGNVVFTCNALLEEDGTVKIYYGAADTNIGLAEGKLDRLVEACLMEEQEWRSPLLRIAAGGGPAISAKNLRQKKFDIVFSPWYITSCAQQDGTASHTDP